MKCNTHKKKKKKACPVSHRHQSVVHVQHKAVYGVNRNDRLGLGDMEERIYHMTLYNIQKDFFQ